MNRILLSAAVLALSAGVALADNLAGYYGNTVVITGPDGSVSKARIKADGTYETTRPDGSVAKGTWAWKDDKTACFTQVTPPAAAGQPNPLCLPIDAHKVGDSWSVKAPDGKETKYSMTAGS
jgi:hypothetical protein